LTDLPGVVGSAVGKWFKFLLYVLPIAATVLNQCKRMQLSPVPPLVGLAIGVLISMDE